MRNVIAGEKEIERAFSRLQWERHLPVAARSINSFL